MEIATLLALLSKLLLAYGPSSLGWVISLGLGWYIVKKKKDDSTMIKDIQNKLFETKDSYIDKVQAMNDRLGELNQTHSEIINHISEQRVDDLKVLSDEYNKLATNTLRTLDKFVVAIEVSNGFKKRKSSGENNND